MYARLLFTYFSIALYLVITKIRWLWSQRQSCSALRWEPLWLSPLLDHYQPHFSLSATATAINATEVHIVPDFQDA
jgi:hypothetical protein